MTTGPKDPRERALWKLQRHIDHYGMGADMLAQVYGTGRVAQNYYAQADAGNAAWLAANAFKGARYDLIAFDDTATPRWPLEIDYAAVERRILAAYPGYYAYHPVFNLDDYLTATARLKEYPRLTLTRAYRRLFAAGVL